MMILLLIPLGIILSFIGLLLIDKGGYRKTDLFNAENHSTADIKAYKGWVIFTALISLISSFVSLAFR
jgi:hypothetical protein